MEINKGNYEAYLLDYFEHNLNTTQVAELMVFLEANPELKLDFIDPSQTSIRPDLDMVYPDKDGLKKEWIKPYSFLHAGNYEEYFAASVDHMLNPSEEEDLHLFIKLNPDLEETYRLYSLTILSPDPAIVFDNKSGLKKSTLGLLRPAARQWVYSSLAAAAGIALLIGLFFDFSPAGFYNPTGNGSLASAQRPDIESHRQGKDQLDRNIALSEIRHYKPGNAAGEGIAAPAPSTRATDFVKPSKELLAAVEPVPGIGTASLSIPIATSNKLMASSRSNYTELYSYIQLREQREYLEYLAVREERPWYAKVLGGVKSSVFGPDEYDPKGLTRDNELWALAEAGLKGINLLTRSDMKLVRELDENGKTASYALVSDRLTYATKVGK